MLAAAATVSCGASQGLESPSTLIGAGIGKRIETFLRPLFQSARYRGLLMTSGASAGIAAIFASPFVGAFYGVEVPMRNGMNLRFLIPATIASVCSFLVDGLIRGARSITLVSNPHWADGMEMATALAVALTCGIGAHLFCRAVKLSRTLADYQSDFRRGLIAGIGLVMIAGVAYFVIGQWVSFGPGHIASSWAYSGPHITSLILLVLCLHTMGTLLCVYGGAAGGVFTSMALAGMLIGMFFATQLGYSPSGLLPLIGAGCFLRAGYRIPFAGLALILTQSLNWSTLLIGTLAMGIAYLLMGQQSVASSSTPKQA